MRGSPGCKILPRSRDVSQLMKGIAMEEDSNAHQRDCKGWRAGTREAKMAKQVIAFIRLAYLITKNG